MSNEISKESDAPQVTDDQSPRTMSADSYNYERLNKLHDSDVAYTDHLNSHQSPPGYLGFLRFFGGLSLFIGIVATLLLVILISKEFGDSYGRSNGLLWLIALAIAIESYLAFGLLNAIADIAQNMIEVGNYVRRISDLKKPRSSN